MARSRAKEFWIGDVRQHGRKWRFQITSGGEAGYRTYETEEEARTAKRTYEKELLNVEKGIQEAMDEYELHLRDINGRGVKPITRATTINRLSNFFPNRSISLRSLTEQKCESLYETIKVGKAVDTHRNTLSEAKTFLNYCVKKKWLAKNPLADVMGCGLRNKQKEKLTVDEAKKWDHQAVVLCDYFSANSQVVRYPQDRSLEAMGLDKPLAALTALYLGYRVSEIVDREVRDLDQDGTVLNVPRAKTKRGERNQQIPQFLRPYFAVLAKNKLPRAKLFACSRFSVLQCVKRICRMADVPLTTVHGMRGLFSTLAIRGGALSEVVAREMGHENFSETTAQHYVEPGTSEYAQQQRVVAILKGGK